MKTKSSGSRDDREQAPQIPASPAPARAAGPPEDHGCAQEQGRTRDDREQARVVIARGGAVLQVVRAGNAERDPDGADGHRDGGAGTGAEAWVEPGEYDEDRERHEPAGEVIRRPTSLDSAAGSCRPAHAERQRRSRRARTRFRSGPTAAILATSPDRRSPGTAGCDRAESLTMSLQRLHGRCGRREDQGTGGGAENCAGRE